MRLDVVGVVDHHLAVEPLGVGPGARPARGERVHQQAVVIREPAAEAGSRVGGQAGETVLARPLGGDAEPVVGEGEGRVEIDRDAERLLRGDVAARSAARARR